MLINKNQGKKILASILSGVMLSTTLSVPAMQAYANADESSRSSKETQIDINYKLDVDSSFNELEDSGVDTDLLDKVLKVSDHLHFNNDNESLYIDLTNDELREQYDFTNQQVEDLEAILVGSYGSSYEPSFEGSKFRASGKRFYIDNDALVEGAFVSLVTAATVGPEALMATWTALSSAGGPLGVIFGVSTSLLGKAFFANLVVKITGAVAQNKGIAFYLDWGVPPLSVEIE